MPSTSAQQAKFMTACAKGWDAESCPPMAVARKFHEADKKEGKYLCKEGCEHGAKKEAAALDDAGGTVVAPPLGAMARLKLVRQLAGVKADIAAAGSGPMAALKRLRLVATANQVRAQLGAAVRTPAPAETAPEVLPAAVPPEVLVIEPAVTVAEEPADDTAFGLQSRGKKTRERINAQVVSITDQVRAGRDPKSLSADDIALLKQYSGKGGLTDNSQYEYYTPTPLAEGTWDILKANGFQNGNVLEPSTGAGVFSATKPAGAVITGTEIDPVAATVNAVLHPEDSILNQSFEKLAMSAPDNFFDAVVGNVPFGNARGAPAGDDPAYKHEKQIERYFITRVIDKTRPGGLITLVVPAGVVANATGPWKRFRAEISRKAEFLGAHKLPSKTFAAQGTDVVTDIIVLRKHSADFLDKVGSLPADLLESTNVLWGEFISGQYWKGEGVRFIHGQYIPADKTKIRSMEQVIPEEGSTPESLKRKLAVQFESRIDWAALESAEPVIVYYAAGDRRIVNGREMEFDGQHWAEVQYVAPAGTLDAAKYGADNMEALQAMASDPESMLSLSSDQAFRIYKDFPNLLSAQLKMAVEFAQSQPLDAFREQAYRGSLIGSSVTRYIARSNTGDDDEGDRTHLRNIVEGEFSKFGHPRSAKGFYLEGEAARYFGAYLNAVDENGRVSDALADGMAGALGYDPKNPRSVAEYLVRAKDDGLLTFESFKETYEGPGVNSLADVADFDGLAISPDGMITTMAAYCSGEVYVKAGALMAAMEAETDSRIKAKYQAMIDLMMTKVKRTGIEDITFGLRDRWIKARYKLDFLKQEGYALRYVVQGEKESDTGETFIGNVDGTDSDDQNGIWVIERYTRAKSDFPGQLEHYMAGRSIGHNIRDKGNESASERIARFREQINGLEERFGHYMQTHEDFAEIERTYNLTFNNYVAPERDDSDLGLTGISGQVKPHPFQNQGVRYLSEEGTGILGDDVGLGKTSQAIAFSLYDRQMGRSKKHCIVVPKAVLANWYMESKKFIGNHEGVMFVGFEPKRGKDGVILTEPVLDENGKPKPNKFTGEIEMQDLLVEDSPAEVFQKMHSIPQSSVGLVIMTYEKYATIPMREESRLKYAEKWAEKSMMSRADAEKIGKSYQEAKSELKAEGDFANDGTKKKQELPYFEDMGFDRIIVDEFHCFPYGTQIMTIDGPMEIGDIVERRIDTKILSCDTATGELSYRDITGWMPKAMLTRMVRVDHANGHFLCTENHLIWTVEESYVEAGKLNQGHTLQVLRGEVHSEVSNPGVLQQGVRTEVDSLWNEGAADLPAMRDGVLCGSDQAGSEKEEVLQHVVLGAVAKLDSGNEGCRQQGGREAQGRPAWPVSGLLGTDESQQSDVQSGNGSEGIFLNEGEGSSFERGERASFDPADSALHCARGWVGDGVRNQHEGCSAPIRPSFKSLQGGHCESGPEDCGGAGRLLSQLAEIEGVGCQKGSHLVGSRVARVSVLEPADFDRYGLGSPFAQVVYDIEVEGNHNFFAEGVLAHNCFKNSFSMGADAQKLAYLPNPAPSQRARDMAMKCAWLREKYDGKGVIGLTATPVANSPIEIFNMLSLVIDSAEFERLGIYTPDDFVRQFGMIQDVEKVRVSGEVVNVEGLAGFKNLNALRALFHRYALMRNAASVDPNGDVLRLPDSVEMMTEATMNDMQEVRYANLRSEAKDAGNPQKIKSGEARPMFAVIRDMDRVTTDMDLYNREMTFLFKQADQSKVDALIAALPATISYKMLDEDSGEKVTVELSKATDYTLSGDTITYIAPENYEDAIVGLFPRVGLDYASHPLTPKYAKLMANMQSELDSRGKQIVFTEEKSQHGKLARLIVQNLPVSADQVAIINATTADGEKLQQISDAYNRGDVRIIIANKKAEVGVNLQKGTSAIHHMTLPWNPASIQQRNGRGVRQGNTVSQVRVYYYQAKGSFDEYRLDLLKNKGNWIASLMDKGNTNDKAENAAAMGALEQAALLADNREEFLKMVADQKAAKDAEETEKRNQAAKVKLNQLGSLTMRLGAFDADKAKARADAEENIVKAQASYDKIVAEEGEEGENAKRRKYQLSTAKTRASKLDGEWEKKKTDMESQRRQAASYLKGMAAKGTLPFDAAVIDAPGECIVTTTRLVVRKGGAYQVKVPRKNWGTDIVRVESVDLATRMIHIVPLVGSVREGDYQADDFMRDAVEVNMTADELETMALLNKEHSYAGIKALGRAFFDKHRAALMVAGYALIRNVDGDLSQAYGRAENELIVFPDESDVALKADMTAIFAAREMGLNNTANGRPVNLASYNFQSFAEAIYGADWKDVLGASLKRASMADLTAKASEILNGLAATEPQSTVEEMNLLAGSVLAGFKGYNRKDLYALGTQALNDWMTAGEFINMGDVKLALNQVATAFRAQIAEKIARKKIEDEKAKIEATRNDPNFKEIPADLAEAFKKIGVDAFYNTEEVATAGKYGSKTWPAFSMIFLKDRAGKNGRVYPVKEILKARFKATFCSSVARGAAKYGDCTWVMPSSTKPQQIYDVLS